MSHWLAPDHGTGNLRCIGAVAQGQPMAPREIRRIFAQSGRVEPDSNETIVSGYRQAGRGHAPEP